MAALESIGNSLVAVWKVSRGKLFGIGASACVTLMFTCVKYTKVTPLVAFFYRCTGAFLVLLCISIFSCGYGLFRSVIPIEIYVDTNLIYWQTNEMYSG